MPEAVIVDTIRTPIGRAFKGSLAQLRPDELGAFVIDELLERNPEVQPSEVEDVFCGCGMPQGLQAFNIARIMVLLSKKLPETVNGVTMSLVLLMYTGASVATTFVVTAGMFGALALFGTTTKRSLAGAGHFFFMGLIGVILASVVGIFWHSEALQFLISVAGVIVFTGLTAWDAQRLKQMALAIPEGESGSYAIVGALSLYLNFINLFLILLRFQGGSRD